MHPLPTSLRRLFSRPYACSLTFHLGLALALGLGTVIGFPRTAEAAAADSDGRLVYFGTYTGKTSKGIYVSRLNPATGRLSVATVAAETTSPSFLAVDPKSRFLYAVNEISTFNGQAAGGVVGYSIERATGQDILQAICVAGSHA